MWKIGAIPWNFGYFSSCRKVLLWEQSELPQRHNLWLQLRFSWQFQFFQKRKSVAQPGDVKGLTRQDKGALVSQRNPRAEMHFVKRNPKEDLWHHLPARKDTTNSLASRNHKNNILQRHLQTALESKDNNIEIKKQNFSIKTTSFRWIKIHQSSASEKYLRIRNSDIQKYTRNIWDVLR